MPTIILPPWARYLILSLIVIAAAAYHTVSAMWPGSIAAHVIAGFVEAIAGLAVLFGLKSPPATARVQSSEREEIVGEVMRRVREERDQERAMEKAIRDEVGKITGSIGVLLLVSSLLLGGCAKFAECMDGSAVKLSQPGAYHVSDDVIDAIDLAIARGYAVDSDGWRTILGELIKRLGSLAACLISGAAGDLLGHVDASASAGGDGPPPLSACRACHHAHAPRPEHRVYLEALTRLRRE